VNLQTIHTSQKNIPIFTTFFFKIILIISIFIFIDIPIDIPISIHIDTMDIIINHIPIINAIFTTITSIHEIIIILANEINITWNTILAINLYLYQLGFLSSIEHLRLLEPIDQLFLPLFLFTSIT